MQRILEPISHPTTPKEPKMTSDHAFLSLGRTETTPAGGRYHTVPPPGEYPTAIHLKDGSEKPGILVVDSIAYDRIVGRFQDRAKGDAFPGLLVDREHESENPKGNTVACAWAKSIERRDDGLWTDWDLTPLGEELLTTGMYKFRSPVLILEQLPGSGNRYRPVELKSIGLTNMPHFKNLAASLNRETGDNQEVTPMPLLEKLVARLKLAAGATEDVAYAAVDQALAKSDADSAALVIATARVTELETAVIERDAAEFVSKHKERFGDEGKLKALFVANRKAAEDMVALLKPAPVQPEARVLARADARPPAHSPATELDKAATARAAEQNDLINNIRARPEYRGAQFDTVWAIAQREKPELFTK
jgi:hypothetical protein